MASHPVCCFLDAGAMAPVPRMDRQKARQYDPFICFVFVFAFWAAV